MRHPVSTTKDEGVDPRGGTTGDIPDESVQSNAILLPESILRVLRDPLNELGVKPLIVRAELCYLNGKRYVYWRERKEVLWSVKDLLRWMPKAFPDVATLLLTWLSILRVTDSPDKAKSR